MSSGWDIGNHDSDELVNLRKQLTDKDSQYANVQSQLLKRTSEFEEMKFTMGETIQKLRHEADRALGLEEELTRCSENLQTEKVIRENAETTAAAAQARIREQERVARDLQTIINDLSNRADGTSTAYSQLQQERIRLENRVMELQTNLQEVVMTPAPARRGHRRTSSLSDGRRIVLEQELNEVRAIRSRHETELRSTRDELQRTHTQLCVAENERNVVEKRLRQQIGDLEAIVGEREDEISILRAQQGDDSAGAREQDLLDRIEQEEVQVAALNQMVDELEAAKRSLQKKLEAEAFHIAAAETRNIELVVEKQGALDELYDMEKKLKDALETVLDKEAQVQALVSKESDLGHRLEQTTTAVFQAQSPLVHAESTGPSRTAQSDHGDGSAMATNVERLLAAIERLRFERDGLRRDLEFLHTESKITIETLETKLQTSQSTSNEPNHVVITQLQQELDLLRARLAENSFRENDLLVAKDLQIRQLELATMASAVVIGRLQSQINCFHDQHLNTTGELESVRAHLNETLQISENRDRLVMELKVVLEERDAKMSSITHELAIVQGEREELVCTLSRLEDRIELTAEELSQAHDESREVRETLSQTELRLIETLKSLEDIESQRDSLLTEATNLRAELLETKDELIEAEDRYSSLRAQELSTLSSYELTRVLRDQIETLEQRVLRRTEQIGVLQHDIKRLETNTRLQEERVTEMMTELEMMTSQKEAMVEDCAAAREARDDALMRVDTLETEVETLEGKAANVENDREREIAALVLVWAKAVTSSRAHIRATQGQNAQASEELMYLRAAQRKNLDLLEEKTTSLRSLDNYAKTVTDELRQVTLTLAAVQVELRGRSDQIEILQNNLDSLNDNLSSLQEDARTKDADVSCVTQELKLVESHRSEAVARNDALTRRILELESKLSDLQHDDAEFEARHREEIRILACSRDELQQLLSENDSRARGDSDSKDEMEHLRLTHSQELDQLRGQLEQAASNLEEVKAGRDRLEFQQQQIQKEHAQSQKEMEALLASTESKLEEELNRLRDSHMQELSDVEKRVENLNQDIQAMKLARDDLEAQHQRTVEELDQTREDYEKRLSEGELHRTKLQEDIDRLGHERDTLKEDLSSITDRHHLLEEEQSDLCKELTSTQLQLQEAQSTLESLYDEKSTLQIEISKLGSQMKTAQTLRLYLEDKVKDCETAVSSLEEQLRRARVELIRSEKAEKEAEMSLALQNTQYDHTLGTLKREIAGLKSKPSLEGTVAELEAKIAQMDELLRDKSAEIEENDDKFIDLLKEKKKLTAKVEALTRKVQNLQSRLAASKGPSPVSEGPKPSCSQQHAVSVPPLPSLPPLAATSSVPSTPTRHSRVASGPSAIPRPKTPEAKVTPRISVKPKTPERKSTTSSGTPKSPSVAGQKRSVPDDFDDCDSVPLQGVIAGRLPTFGEENTTPRIRKPFQAARTGFTPQRNSAVRPTVKQASPRRMTATTAATHVISDVTNSPRGESRATNVPSKSFKSSWLGKIRGASAQVPPGRSFSSRTPYDDPRRLS